MHSSQASAFAGDIEDSCITPGLFRLGLENAVHLFAVAVNNANPLGLPNEDRVGLEGAAVAGAGWCEVGNQVAKSSDMRWDR